LSAVLEFVAGPEAGRTVVLSGDRPVTLGSDPRADVQLTGPGVSAAHALLVPGGTGRWAVQGLGEEPTRVNDAALHGALCLLTAGDVIRLGPHTLVLHAQPEAPAPTLVRRAGPGQVWRFAPLPRPVPRPVPPAPGRFRLLSCYVIVGLCVAVWLVISAGEAIGLRKILGAALLCALDPQAVVEGWMWWQLVTYAFVHVQFWHIAFNGIALASFGGPFETAFGTRRFLTVFGAGVLASGLACMVEAYVPLLFGHAMRQMLVIGASGGVCALLVCFAAWQPDARVILAFVIPLRASLLVVVLLAIDIIGLVLPGHGIAHSGHIGGTLVGLALCPYIVGRWPWRSRRHSVTP
jgi:membrane associated rhomboid family serine protease